MCLLVLCVCLCLISLCFFFLFLFMIVSFFKFIHVFFLIHFFFVFPNSLEDVFFRVAGLEKELAEEEEQKLADESKTEADEGAGDKAQM